MKLNIRANFVSAFQLIKSIILYADQLCKPTHKYLKDKVDQEVIHVRNRAMLAIHFIVASIFFLDVVVQKGPLMPSIIGIATCIIVVSFMILSCRYHPEVFNIFYNILITAYGPHLAYKGGAEGLHTAWLAVSTFPVFIVLATGSLKHFMIHGICQMIFLNTFYQDLMEQYIEFVSPKEFVKTLTYATNITVIFHSLFVAAITQFLSNAYRRISIVEQKKEESEKQKTFLLGFSHELRNLINSVLGNVKLATLERLPERAKDLLLSAEVCGELLIHLVNNILDTGKVEIGDLEINPTPIRVYDILEKVWGVCSELIKRKNLRGKMKISKHIPPCLKLDHYRLTQIFLNLVGNAIKFTDRGSIDIAVEWISNQEEVTDKCFEPFPFNDENDQEEGIFEKSQTLSMLNSSLMSLTFLHRKVSKEVVAQQEPQHNRGILKIVVTDTGCGISKEDLEKLFQKFTQVTDDISKRKLGTGLGLFITKELCNRMGGQVRAFSKKDRGSSFICCIPADPYVEQRAHPVDLDSIKQMIMRKRLKAMVVDDVQFNHIILKDFFSNLGVQVIDIAENGAQAYEKFRDHSFKEDFIQIVTMDLYMPVMDGKEASKKIREFEDRHGIEPCLLIVVSANCAESEIRECIDVNGPIRANAFLKKPATIDELSRVIGNYILEWHNRRSVGH